MFVSLEFLGFVYIFFILVQCEIPGLNVRRLDRSLIAKKRQDTLDMCRVFTEENAKIDDNSPKIIPSYNHVRTRRKRQIDMKYLNPALKEEDAQRVEDIVNKLYDDMTENGEKVTYIRRRNTSTTIAAQVQVNDTASGRRLFFAPQVLDGPVNGSKPVVTPTERPVVQRARWTHGIIPYYIDSNTYDAHLQLIIATAFEYMEKATCVRLQKLRERPTDERSLRDVGWVYVTNPAGVRQCVHSNEKRRIDGVQMIVLGYDCLSLGDIVHEVMHILGFSHEHTRADRDRHVAVLWGNVKPGYKKYFEVNKVASEYNLEHLPYDYSSVMHYPPRAFSRNGQVTLLTDSGIKIGQREGLSEIDVQKVGFIYSSECVERNRQYLLKTCPSVVKAKERPVRVAPAEINNYFKDRLWPYGVVNYKLRDRSEFSIEERENIMAVFRHIEKETCIRFNDVSEKIDDASESTSQEYSGQDNKPEDNNQDQDTVEFMPNLPEIIMVKPLPANISYIARQSEKNLEKGLDMIVNERDNIIGTETSLEQPPQEPRKDVMKVYLENATKKVSANNSSPSPRVRREASPYVERRHANNIIVLTRSPAPGCACPPPGKRDGNQELSINADCFNSVNELLHVFVHVLGLDHQHNMHDRDQYLHVVWNNLTADVRQDMEHKLPPAASAGFAYDYQSVMHYPWLQIKDGLTNIMYPIWNDGWAMGHWQGLSSIDVQKLNILYFSQCTERQKIENE